MLTQMHLFHVRGQRDDGAADGAAVCSICRRVGPRGPGFKQALGFGFGAGVNLQWVPSRNSRWAMALPMTPVPIQPIRGDVMGKS